MMHFWLLFSAAPLALGLPPPLEKSSPGTSIAVRSPGEVTKQTAAPFFYPWPGKLKKGGCDEHIDKIDTAYDEAVTLAVGAKNALEMLKKARPKDGADVSKEDYNKGLEWDKYQQSLKDLFNIELDTCGGDPDEEMKKKIQEVQDIFELVAKNKGSDGADKDKDKPRLMCGDQGLATCPAGEKLDPDNDKEKPAGENGAWVYPGKESKSSKKNIPYKKYNKRKDEKDLTHPCQAGGDKALGYTPPKANTIFFCPAGLKLEATLAKAEEGKTLEDTLRKTRAMSDTFLHEMLHLFTDFDDVAKVKYASSKEEKAEDSEPVWKDEANKVPERSDKVTYGYVASYNLAQYVPADALKTPETFVWFAISVFFKDLKFEGKQGMAKKMEWKK